MNKNDQVSAFFFLQLKDSGAIMLLSNFVFDYRETVFMLILR